MESTRLRGARTHNLKGVDLDLAPGQLVVLAGVSGSGKSSLALDTLYAEGQRRFVESFSPYARQFLERRERPPLDQLEPVPAAIAVDRGSPVRTSRSTVGTMTELHEHLRLLWARASVITCEKCGTEVLRGTVAHAVDGTLARASGAPRVVLSWPIETPDAERYLAAREGLLESGWRRAWIDGAAVDLDELAPSRVVAQGALHVLVDRFVLRESERGRLAEGVSVAFARGRKVTVTVLATDARPEETLHFAAGLVCSGCGTAYRDPTPALFSFHSPLGACEACKGFGRVIELDLDKVIPDPTLSIVNGAIKPWTGPKAEWERKQLLRFCNARGYDAKGPWAELSAKAKREIIEHEDKSFHGVRPWFDWLEGRTYKMHVRVFLSRFRKYSLCPSCHGSRLKPESSRYRVAGLSLIEAGQLPVSELRARLATVGSIDDPTERLRRELDTRVGYLEAVGLGYLTLERPSRTLSGGELQRVALTAALGTSLTGTLMVLDEPTVGLHPRDASRLVAIARGLARMGNLPLVVEHDLSVIASADRVIELGPGAGERGGNVVFDGAPSKLRKARTPTGDALRGEHESPARRERRAATQWLTLRNARGNNLRNVTLRVPLGVLTCVTGVSGSGKSTLISETLAPAVQRALGEKPDEEPLAFDALEGAEALRAVRFVEQGSLGRTSRGNPATYLKAWDAFRTQFAALPESRERKYTAGTFSFNVEGGRCPTCKGEGSETVEMQFLADVTFQCPDCGGKRFRDEVLELRLRGYTAADVLGASVDAVLRDFGDLKAVRKALEPLVDVGLGYLTLGHPLSMLSGGEAQRLKLARALAEVTAGTLVVLDEPTAGLHRADVSRVLAALETLVTRGATVLLVEHDPWVTARADWVLDLGPEAGAEGGTLVAQGTPEHVAQVKDSRMAPFLRAALANDTEVPEPETAPPPTEDPAARTHLVIEGAREHNLRIARAELPREQLVVLTGPSGSGKSSLAFDVLYAEGQRRFLETLSPYARQYLPSLGRADVDQVRGIPPAISLEQRTARSGAMSTVATVTEVAHFLRLLYAKVGTVHCPDCDEPLGTTAPDAVLDGLSRTLPASANLSVWAPVVRARKGYHKEVFERARALGIETVLVDGVAYEPMNAPALKKTAVHDLWLWLGAAKLGDREALMALVRRALSLAQGQCILQRDERSGTGEPLEVSTRRACPKCGRGVPELDPRHFSFNTPQGQCETCLGKGVDDDGDPCPSCEGSRLAPLGRGVRLGGLRLHELLELTPGEVRTTLGSLTLGPREKTLAEAPRTECMTRLGTLESLGLDYLALGRPASTLSGGEMQRLRLAAQLGAGLTGVLYVLDEPTIGLHASDTWRLLGAMRKLVDKGASVLVVEHDADVIRAADYVVDMGETGGRGGGLIVAQGPAAQVLADVEHSATARSLRADPARLARGRAVDASTPALQLKGVRAHNIKDLDFWIPLGRLVCVAGVSGSGKSTLIEDVLYPAVRRALGVDSAEPLEHDRIVGVGQLRACKMVDQQPLGRTSRSVPATYLGLWDELRKMLAATQEARARGWGPGRFSFNTPTEKGGGRCETCLGAGVLLVEMSFLPDVVVPCEACEGQRFSRETREVKLHGYSAGELLALTVREARQVFAQVSSLSRTLALMDDLGLGYLTLGQGSHTLSGGEAQRVKLVDELQGRGGGTLYVLDEPTTGLHLDDVARLVTVLQALVDRGDSLVLVEHHPSVLAAADWLIELGPGGGKLGGQLVSEGPPALVARGNTATGPVLRGALTGTATAAPAARVEPAAKSEPKAKAKGAPKGKRAARE